MKDLLKALPTSFKALAVLGIALQLSLIGFVIWVVFKLLQHFGVI